MLRRVDLGRSVAVTPSLASKADRRARHASTAVSSESSCSIARPPWLDPTTVLMLWATGDDVVDLYGDPLAVWKHWADNVTGYGVDSGHHMAEEAPDQFVSALDRFLPR